MAYSFNNFNFFLFMFMILPSANSVYFNVPRFGPDLADIAFQGDQSVYSGFVEMTNINYKNRVGWVTCANKIPIWDKSTGKLTDFSTNFSFNIDTQGSSSYGHGFVFFLAPAGSTIPPNSGGGFLGMFNTSTTDSSQNQIVTVEFDSFANVIDGWDPDFQHVGINNNSISSSIYTFWNASVHSGDAATVLVTYNSTTKKLSVAWTYQTTNSPKENSSLSYIIDLREAVPEFATVGFSAATGSGDYVERNYLLSWEFNSSLEIKENGNSSKRRIAIIVGVIAAGVLMALFVLVTLVLTKKKQRKEAEHTTSTNEDIERGAGPRKFSYKELASATNNFSDERKLGEGGFGAVYKGYIIKLDLPIAVKKFSGGSKEGKKSYLTEVKAISQLRHRNLVQLIGWCHDRGEFLLVYEFMPKRSLDSHLFGKIPLAWAVRYNIARGLASALLYLHEEWEQCVLHRDIKASNVMLDSSFKVKLGDFGLARLMDHELRSQTTGLVGTLGYLAPEFILTGRASKESDVYSFGIVLLEIVTGRQARQAISEDSEMNLLEWVWELYGGGNLKSGVDEKLREEYDERQAECLMVVGLWCAHGDRSLRPSIRQAMNAINFEAPLPNLQAKVPAPVHRDAVPDDPPVNSANDITFTSMEVGR